MRFTLFCNFLSQSHSCSPVFSQSFLLSHIPTHQQGHIYSMHQRVSYFSLRWFHCLVKQSSYTSLGDSWNLDLIILWVYTSYLGVIIFHFGEVKLRLKRIVEWIFYPISSFETPTYLFKKLWIFRIKNSLNINWLFLEFKTCGIWKTT